MKKTTISICIVALALAAVAGTSVAKNSHSGPDKSKGYPAKHWHGTISPAVSSGSVKGRVKADQNKKFTRLNVHLRGLTPSGTYQLSLNEQSCADSAGATGATGATGSTGSTGATGATGTTGTAAVTRTVVANSAGHAKKNVKVKRSVLTLLTTGAYSVQVADASNVTVACGDLVAKKKGKSSK